MLLHYRSIAIGICKKQIGINAAIPCEERAMESWTMRRYFCRGFLETIIMVS